jgi:hypothetical protein
MDYNRRHLACVALLGGSAALLGGCASLGASVSADASKVAATIETDVPTLTNIWAITKGVAEVALTALSLTDPAAASVISAGIKVVDGYIAQGANAVAANAATIVTTTQTVLAAAAPAITVIKNA